MRIEIRPEICILMCNYAAVKKMEAFSWLVPELRSEKHRRRGTQLFEKTQCFYVAKCLCILLYYVKLTRILVKKQLESRQRQLGKTVGKDSGWETGAYIVSRQKDNHIQTGSWWNCIFLTCTMMSIATRSCISLTCLWVRFYIVFIVAELLTQIQYLWEVPGFRSVGHIFVWCVCI